MKLFIDPKQMKAQYDGSPDWLKQLMDAWADGLNFYLLKHPEVHPRVIQHFEPWMALTFSEGSIGGDIEGISLPAARGVLWQGPQDRGGGEACTCRRSPPDRMAFAIAPANTASGHALLLINPHTSFFFRSELQMVSEEGLNAYGAVTWGQFFVYQGFNDRLGWMHTSSGVDAIDEYAETMIRKGDSLFYRVWERGTAGHGRRRSRCPIKTDTGMARKEFTVYRTQHGPIVREAGGKWVSVRLMQEPVKALTESYTRTKARDYRPFEETVDLRTNSSNNTVYADADGNIAYFHASFIPKRDPRFDWSRAGGRQQPSHRVAGPALRSTRCPIFVNPANGWIQNTNNWPYSAAGAEQPEAEGLSRATWRPTRRTRAASTRCGCWRGRRTSPSSR